MIQFRFSMKKDSFMISCIPNLTKTIHIIKLKYNTSDKVLFNKKHPKLTTSERIKCEVEINKHTCAEVVSKLKKKGKIPGIDGIPAEFKTISGKT